MRPRRNTLGEGHVAHVQCSGSVPVRSSRDTAYTPMLATLTGWEYEFSSFVISNARLEHGNEVEVDRLMRESVTMGDGGCCM